MKKRSNLDMMGAVMLMFCWREEGKIERKRMEVRGGGGEEREGRRIEPMDKEEIERDEVPEKVICTNSLSCYPVLLGVTLRDLVLS